MRLFAGILRFMLAASFLAACPPPAVGQTPPTRTGTVETNGVRLFYRITGSGPAVLLVHGLGATGSWWDDFVPDLAGDHTVIVPDLRGHGLSTNPTGAYNHSLVATDLLGLLDSLRLDRVSAVGHSSGAAALLHLASEHPSSVTRVVVIGMGARLTPEQRANWRAYPSFDHLSPFLRRYFLDQQPGGESQVNAILGYLRGLGADTTDINFDAQTLGNISAKTLIIAGDRDGHTIENVTALYRMIPGSRLWIVPGQGHFPFWPAWGGDSTMARTFSTVLRQFLADTARSRDVAAERAAVRGVLARSAQALEQHDWTAYATVWAHDSDISVVHPAARDWVDGWAQVANKYQAFIADTAGHFRAASARQDVHLSPSGDVAWVTQQDTLYHSKAGRSTAVLQWSTAVLEKRHGEWKLIHAHASQLPLGR